MAKKDEQKHEYNHELEQKYSELQYMQQHLQQLNKQMQELEQKSQEIIAIKTAIEDLKSQKKDTELLVPISNGIFIKAKAVDMKNLLVNVGADVVVKKTPEDTKELLDTQSKEIDKYKKNIYEQMVMISEQIRLVEQDLSQHNN